MRDPAHAPAGPVTELLRGIRVVAWREVLRLLGQRPRLLASIATPLLFFGLFGAGFNRLVGELLPGIDLITFMFPGIVAMTVIMPSLFTGMSVVWDREFGFLREILVAPLDRMGIALGKVGGGALVATAEGLVILLLGPLIGVSLSPVQVGEIVGLMLLLSVLLSSFGILVGTRIRSQQAFQTVMALVIFPILFLSGVFFPVAATPGWISVVTRLNPVTYGVDAMRQVLLRGSGMAAGIDSAVVGAAGEATSIRVSVAGHTLGVGEEVAVMVVISMILVWAASRAFRSS